MPAVELAVRKAPDPNERELSQLEEAEEVKRVLADFRDVVEYLLCTKKIPVSYRAGPPEQTTDHDLLCLAYGTTSMILRRDGDRGGIHFIEVDKNEGPKVYGHTQTAITKIRQFLEQFRLAIKAS